MAPRYVAVGSICWDHVPVGGTVERRLGGSVLFAARVAAAAGWDVHVVTSGTEELEAAARAALEGVELTVARSEVDTVMAFGDHAELGPQWVPTSAAPIDVAAAGHAFDRADVVHLAPIMGEITPEMVAEVRAEGPRLVGITPQGLLRGLDGPERRLRHLDRLPSWWAPSVDVAVVSDEEHVVIDDVEALLAANTALAVTRRERGCVGYLGTAVIEEPGIEIGEVVQGGTIGAGDTFAATLFIALAGGAPFAAALARANQVAGAYVAGWPLPLEPGPLEPGPPEPGPLGQDH